MRFSSISVAARTALFAAALPALPLAVGCSNSGATHQSTAGLCGSSATVPDGGFLAAAFLTFVTPATNLRIEVRTSPCQPIEQGEGVAELRITDAITDATRGDPVDGLTISVVPYMPDMGHKASELATVVEPQGNGVYLVTRLAFIMAGKGELKMTITGARTENVVSPTFEIPK
jgi:hypothetical protein